MDREQIIKALECCLEDGDCTVCPLIDVASCPQILNENALSLIKELAAELEVLKADRDNYKEWYFQTVEENKNIKADTVRKMQERVIAEIEQTPNANEHFINAWKSKIDQIAKEMLEGG